MKFTAAVAGFSLALGFASASMAQTFYTDYATWSAATTGVVNTTIPDPVDPIGFDSFGTGDGSVTYGGVTYSISSASIDPDSILFNVGPVFSQQPAVVSVQGGSTSIQQLSITLPTFVTAFAMNFDTFNGSFLGIFNGHGADTVSSTANGYDASDFFGMVDSVGFNTVTVTAFNEGVLNVNNISYGSAQANVPEPAAWALMLLGFGGLGAMLRRRNALAAA